MGVDRNTGKLQARDWEEPPPRKANEELLDHQRKRKVDRYVVHPVFAFVSGRRVIGIWHWWWW